jgi:drug/metabolite transporter (DMT)-like permease
MSQPIAQKRLSLRNWALMGLLALIWGGSFTANHAALTALPVASVVALRVTGAAILLWAYVLWARLPLPPFRRLCRFGLILGVGNNVVPFSLIVWGQTHVPSGLAGILNATTALFQVLVAAAVFPDERLSLPRLSGVIVGLAGVAVIIGPSALGHLDLTSLGQLAILGAGLSYALSAAFARRALAGLRPEVGAAGMLTGASLIMVPTALALDGWPALPPLPALAALAYLSLFASALAYRLFYTIMAEAGAGNLGLVTLLIAPVAVLLGWVFFGERLAASALIGLVLLTLGLMLIDGRLSRALHRLFSA